MNTYRAYVRVPFGDSTTVVETAVCADNTNAAIFLLQGMYGRDNVMGIPTQQS